MSTGGWIVLTAADTPSPAQNSISARFSRKERNLPFPTCSGDRPRFYADSTRRQCTFSPDIQNGGDKHVYDVSDIAVNGVKQADYQDVWTRVRK